MTVRQAEVIERLKAGETVINVLPKGDTESDKAFQYLSGGGRITKATYRKITPNLKPISAGLFPDAEPQEWGWADE
jgi:hypothetical protein